jgi:hypothetical protein
MRKGRFATKGFFIHGLGRLTQIDEGFEVETTKDTGSTKQED